MTAPYDCFREKVDRELSYARHLPEILWHKQPSGSTEGRTIFSIIDYERGITQPLPKNHGVLLLEVEYLSSLCGMAKSKLLS